MNRKYVPLYLVIIGQIVFIAEFSWCSFQECNLEILTILAVAGLLTLAGLISGLITYVKRLRRGENSVSTKVSLVSTIILSIFTIPLSVPGLIFEILELSPFSSQNLSENVLQHLSALIVPEMILISLFYLWFKRNKERYS